MEPAAFAASEFSYNGIADDQNFKVYRFTVSTAEGRFTYLTADLDGFITVNLDLNFHRNYELTVALRDLKSVEPVFQTKNGAWMVEICTDGGAEFFGHVPAEFGIPGILRDAAEYQKIKLKDAGAFYFETLAKDNQDSADYAADYVHLREQLAEQEKKEVPAFVKNTALRDDIIQLIDRGAYKTAQALCDSMMGGGPVSADDFYIVGLLHKKSGQTAKGVDELKRALELEPEHARARLELGHQLYLDRSWAAAAEQFAAGLKAQPETKIHLDLAYYLAETYLQMRKEDKAVLVAKDALDVEERSDLHATAGAAFHRLGQFDRAREHYKAAIALETPGFNLSPVLNNLGGLEEMDGKALIAFTYYKKAYEADPGNDVAFLNYERLRKEIQPTEKR